MTILWIAALPVAVVHREIQQGTLICSTFSLVVIMATTSGLPQEKMLTTGSLMSSNYSGKYIEDSVKPLNPKPLKP